MCIFHLFICFSTHPPTHLRSSRTRFMLDTIAAIKTNNVRKIPNYDPSLLEHMKKVLRGLIRSKGVFCFLYIYMA